MATLTTAQPLDVHIHAIDARGLPRIQLKIAVSRAGEVLPQPGKAAFQLLENGIGLPIEVDCPDSAVINNVALVLDNSGTLGGLAFDSQKTGAHGVVDSLAARDATAIYHFANRGEQVQDFTTDKILLHGVIDNLTLGANTPLYSTTAQALQDLAGRPGNRYCIVFTDGMDNASSISWQDLIPIARAAGIKVFTIGYGNTELSDDILSTIATETGGRYWRIFSAAFIARILREIASDIVSPFCTITYTASGCTDSLRFLQLMATLYGESAVDDTIFQSPFRADTLILSVKAPERLLPGERAIVYIGLDPGVHTGLELSFHFLLRYDADMLDLPSFQVVSVGTMTQNTSATMRRIRPGVLRFNATVIPPAMTTGHLIGVALRNIAADSSRPLVLEIDSVTLTAGCPNTVILVPDTMDVCLCVDTLAWAFDTVAVAEPGSIVDVPFDIPVSPDDSPILLRAWLKYDPGMLEFMQIQDAQNGAWLLQSGEDAGSAELQLYLRNPDPRLSPKLQFSVGGERKPRRVGIHMERLVLYGRCCNDGPPDSVPMWVDGFCEFIVRRRAAVIEQMYPNPASDDLNVQLRIAKGNSNLVQLRILDASGETRKKTLIRAEEGTQTVNIQTVGLPPGRYTILLEGNEFLYGRGFIIVR